MSTYVVHLVPADPWFVPSPEQEDAARLLFAQLMPGGEGVDSIVRWPMGYFDLVQNAGDFWCPRCGAALDALWVMALDEVAPRVVILPCCGGTAELGELRSDTGDCFARFALQITNPDCWDAPPEVIAALSDLLGTPMRSATLHA